MNKQEFIKTQDEVLKLRSMEMSKLLNTSFTSIYRYRSGKYRIPGCVQQLLRLLYMIPHKQRTNYIKALIKMQEIR